MQGKEKPILAPGIFVHQVPTNPHSSRGCGKGNHQRQHVRRSTLHRTSTQDTRSKEQHHQSD